MRWKEIVSRTDHGIIWLSRMFSYFGLVPISLMILLTVGNVIGRYAFAFPIPGTHELECWALAIVCFFTWAYNQANRGNITITFIGDKVPRKFMAYTNAILYSVAVVVYSLMTWRIVLFGIKMMSRGEYSSELRLPEWIIPILAGIALTLFVVILIRDVVKFMVETRRV